MEAISEQEQKIRQEAERKLRDLLRDPKTREDFDAAFSRIHVDEDRYSVTGSEEEQRASGGVASKVAWDSGLINILSSDTSKRIIGTVNFYNHVRQLIEAEENASRKLSATNEEEPVLEQQPQDEAVDLNEIANDISIVCHKKMKDESEESRKKRRDARERLIRNGVDLDSFLKEGLDLEEDEDRRAFGKRKAELRELSEAIKKGKVTAEQRKTLSKIGLDPNSIEEEETVGKRGPGNTEESSPLEEELQDYLNMPPGKDRDDFVRTLLKKRGDQVGAELRRSALNSLTQSLSAEDELGKIEALTVDDNTKKRLFESWMRRYGSSAPKELVERVAAMGKAEGTRAAEIVLSPLDMAEIRERIVLEVGKLSPEANPDAAFQSFLTNQIYRMGRFTGRFPESTEEELRSEFRARAELSMITRYWFDISSTLSPEVSAFKEITAAKIDRCPKISRGTYIWLATRGEMDYRNHDESGVVIEGIDHQTEFTKQLDVALKTVYDRIQSGSNIWLISTKAALDDEVDKVMRAVNDGGTTEELRRRGIRSVHEDTARMAVQLAVAECWGADRDFAWVNHPVFRLTHPAEYMAFLAENGKNIPGGSRLWTEFRRKHEGNMPTGLNAVRVFDMQVDRLSTVGYDTWAPPKKGDGSVNTEGRDALAGHRYLQSMLPHLRGEAGMWEDYQLPQAELMTRISKGAVVWSAIEEIGRADASKVTVDTLVVLRNAFENCFFRYEVAHPDASNKSELRMRKAKAHTGRLMTVWAENLIWQVSWANPENMASENKVVPVGSLNSLIESIVGGYVKDGDPTVENARGEFILDRNRAPGYGSLIGYGLPRNEANDEAIDFIRWYYDEILPTTRQAVMVGLVPGLVGDRYKIELSADRKKKDSPKLYEFTDDKMLQRSPAQSGRIGSWLLGASDDRWWLYG